MKEMDKKKLIWQYVGAIILLIVTIVVMRFMYKDAQKGETTNTTETTIETSVDVEE